MRDNLAKKIGAVSDKPVKSAKTAGIVWAIIAVICAGIAFATPFFWAFAAVALIGSLVSFCSKMPKAKKAIEATKNSITAETEQKIKAGKLRIANTADQWMKAKAKVEGFYALPENKAFALKEA